MEEKKHNNKIIAGMIVGIITLTTLVIGATYAYFSVSTTNSFGTSTINATTDTLGNVTLVGGNASLIMNLTGADMMQGEYYDFYYASPTGTTTDYYQAEVAHTSVSGTGYYNCSYTLNISASSTSAANNLYTAFQGMTGKSEGQINISLSDGTSYTSYDFNTASLFPITHNGTFNHVSVTDVGTIYATFELVNYNDLNQNALQGKDISLTITATSFTCSAIPDPDLVYATYNSGMTVLDSNDGLDFYLKGLDFGTDIVYKEACAIFNGTEICLKHNDWANAATYKSAMEAKGATCNSTYSSDGYLQCSDGNGIYCRIDSYGGVSCHNNYPVCEISEHGDGNCLAH